MWRPESWHGSSPQTTTYAAVSGVPARVPSISTSGSSPSAASARTQPTVADCVATSTSGK